MNSYDGMSAIALYYPEMLMGVREKALRLYCLSSKKRSGRAVGINVEVIPLYAHNTADVLSQNLPMWLNFRSPMIYSSTSDHKTSPANSRSLMVNFTFGFLSNTSSCFMSMGHANCHTQGCMVYNTGVMTPPAPRLQSSVYCKYSG